MRTNRGFTLIELIVVTLILGILIAITLPQYNNFRQRAQVSSVKSNMHTVQVAIEDFSSRNDGIYPANAASTTQEGGLTLQSVLPSSDFPQNPFTSSSTSVGSGSRWQGTAYVGTDPAGGIQINTWTSTGGAVDTYEVVGEDENGSTLDLVLSNN